MDGPEVPEEIEERRFGGRLIGHHGQEIEGGAAIEQLVESEIVGGQIGEDAPVRLEIAAAVEVQAAQAGQHA